MHTLGSKTVLLHNLTHALGATCVNGNHAFEIRVPQVVSFDAGKLIIDCGTGGDLREADRRYCRQNRFDAVYSGLDVQRTGSRDEPGDLSRGDERRNALAHLHTGREEVLPDVSQASI